MKLQLALDLIDENEALEVVREVGSYFDIIEVGTSLLKLCGLSIVYKIKAICPGKDIFIDTKCIDGPEREATLMSVSGATMFSMLACATDTAVKKVLQIAQKNNIKVVFDMQSVDNYECRAKELISMGAELLCVHKNSDCGESLVESFKEFVDIKSAADLSMALAGGINLNSLPEIKDKLNPEIVVIGGAVLKAEDRVKAAMKFREIADK